MRYLVTMEQIEAATTASSQQAAAQHLEQRVIPHDEALIKLVGENKILAGGIMVGRRGAAFIVEVASNEELSWLLQSLPLWGLENVNVIPLENFEERVAQNRRKLEKLKAHSGTKSDTDQVVLVL